MSSFAPHKIDFYKSGHADQYDEAAHITSTWTPRFNRHAAAYAVDGKVPDRVVVVGTQAFCKKVLKKQFDKFFKMPYEKAVKKYQARMDNALGPGVVSAARIGQLHQLKYLPIEVYSLEEGTRCPMKVPNASIRSTHEDFAWVTNYIETVFSNESWKMPTIATIALQYRLLLEKWAEITGADKSFIPWQGHDFSARGQSGSEDAAWSSMGHAAVFYGTDTVECLDTIDKYYPSTDPVIAGSVTATEHSVMSFNIIKRMRQILKDNPNMSKIDAKHLAEVDVVERLITQVRPDGIISIVGDTFNWYRFVNEIIPALKDKILARAPNALGLAKVVCRPDSGNPIHIVAGYRIHDLGEMKEEPFTLEAAWTSGNIPANTELLKLNGIYYRPVVDDNPEGFAPKFDFVEVPEVEAIGGVATLWKHFGGTLTGKGYRVLHERIGMIYGDSITIPIAAEILERLAENNFASTNIVFGIGSFTYQYITRDTFGYAIKAIYGETTDGECINIVKDPITDSSKKSAEGLVKVEKCPINGYKVIDQQDPSNYDPGELKLIFRNSKMFSKKEWNSVRVNVDKELVSMLAAA